MNAFGEGVVTIILAIIGLGIISVLVSPKATTSASIQAIASGLGNDIAVAQSPVTGTPLQVSLGYPGGGNYSNGFGG